MFYKVILKICQLILTELPEWGKGALQITMAVV